MLLTLAENPSCNSECRVCHYKNLDYTTQLKRKQSWAESQLGHWKDALKEIRPAPSTERIEYRSKSWLRSTTQNGEVSFGMFRSIKVNGKWEKEFISWDTCPLHLSAIQEIVRRLKRVLVEQAPDFMENSLVGVWVGTPHLVFISKNPQSELLGQIDWNPILVPPFDRVWFHCNSQVGKKIFGHRPIELIAGTSTEQVHPIRAFRQIAQSLLIEARRQVVAALLKDEPQMVLDLYCGMGEISLLLPPEIGWIGIELSKEAVNYAHLLRSSEVSVHAAFAGAVEQRLSDPRLLGQINMPYALYLNPPRSGLTQEARQKILDLIRTKRPNVIVYLSCSASSLARDLICFEQEGYRIIDLQPFDFFPQTEHFETLAVLT